MKRVLIILILTMIIMAQCSSRQKVSYVFPEAMSEPVRAEFTKICEQGRLLYQQNCAGCHNKIIDGREIIPDFKSEDLKGYEMRISNAQHEENMPENAVTAEELSMISTFLMYKKKSNVPMR